MKGGRRCWPLVLFAMLVGVLPGQAQSTPESTAPPESEATMRFGPLSLKSTIALTNIGVDTNVFNAAAADRPQSDFTMTFTPVTDLWLRLGRTRLNGTIDVDWVYYQTFASERSANADYRAAATRSFGAVTVHGAARHLSTRDRPGFEIDARSDRSEAELDGSVEIQASPTTYLGARAWRRRVAFDRDELFRGANLAEELNRTESGRAVTVRRSLTPLTTVSLQVGREYERFLVSPLRDADSTRIAGTVTFDPLALISGRATVGHRRFTPLASDVPPYRGTTTAMALSYTLFGTTRFGFDTSRDVQPSLEFEHPYYLETGIGGSVQHQVFGPFDVRTEIGTRRLAYRDRLGAAARGNRTDRVHSFSIGGGYRLGTDKRVGFDIERHHRTSSINTHGYSGLRFGISLTYET